MDDIQRPSALRPNVRMGVRGLPSLINNMVDGGLYVLIAETASARFPLLTSSLDGSLKDGRQCAVIVPANPEHFVQRLQAIGTAQSEEAMASGQLVLFEMQEEFSKKMFRFGAERFVQELENFDVADDSFLLMDQADDLISLHDISLALEQIDILGKWLLQHRVTAMLVFLRITESQAGTLNALMDSFSGIARLGGDAEGLRLNFDYWQSPEGAVAARSFHLRALESGLYEASDKATENESVLATVAPQEAEPDLPSEAQYFYMDPELGSLASELPGEWVQVDTLVGMMHATRNKRRSMVILCYRSDTNVRQLAEAVHTLRTNLGRYVQIVVQEKDASLRYQNEALLLRLGINLVVHRDVQAARLALLFSSIQGQMFNRDVNVDFEAALGSVSPARLKGYQIPARFAREIEVLLERTTTLNIPFALIVGRTLPGLAMIDVINSLRLSRSGDLISADNENCYIFLNACQQSVVLATLERILGASVDAVFSDVQFQVSRENVQHDLAALLHNAEVGMVIDHTPNLITHPVAESTTRQSDEDVTSAGRGSVAFTPAAEAPRWGASASSVAATASKRDTSQPQGEEVSLYRRANPQPDAFGRADVPWAKRSLAKTS